MWLACRPTKSDFLPVSSWTRTIGCSTGGRAARSASVMRSTAFPWLYAKSCTASLPASQSFRAVSSASYADRISANWVSPPTRATFGLVERKPFTNSHVYPPQPTMLSRAFIANRATGAATRKRSRNHHIKTVPSPHDPLLDYPLSDKTVSIRRNMRVPRVIHMDRSAAVY